MDQHTLSTAGLSATITAAGAELCSVRGPDGAEYLWQAGPAWPRHAPVLFPIVGRLKDDTLHVGGQAFHMTQHGFARDLVFEWVERTPTLCRLTLVDDAMTRASYPFAFRLELTYALSEAGLTQTFSVTNTGTVPLPASFGAHPAFVWPLAPGLPKEAHTLTFSDPETAPLRRVVGGLMIPDAIPNPVHGRTLPLTEALFAHDALIFEHPASTSVRFAAPGARAITVGWTDMPQLGIWTKPGDFLCIEPWCGISSPEDFDGEFADKPGVVTIPPGATRTGALVITISSNPD